MASVDGDKNCINIVIPKQFFSYAFCIFSVHTGIPLASAFVYIPNFDSSVVILTG